MEALEVEESLPALVVAVAERIEDTLIELPKRYESAQDMAVDVIHDQARKDGTSFAEAARKLLLKTA